MLKEIFEKQEQVKNEILDYLIENIWNIRVRYWSDWSFYSVTLDDKVIWIDWYYSQAHWIKWFDRVITWFYKQKEKYDELLNLLEAKWELTQQEEKEKEKEYWF